MIYIPQNYFAEIVYQSLNQNFLKFCGFKGRALRFFLYKNAIKNFITSGIVAILQSVVTISPAVA